jgi:DivIVA domain-containing protein
MAVSSVRVDPASPASVAEASFSSSRRGYDQVEVREALRAVAAELGRLQERERFLERELRLAQEAQPPAPTLDDDTAARLLGEETVRVLQTARESAAQIRAKAEESAARIVKEAADEASRIRADAEVEISRRRSESAAEAEAELALAKSQGREMVNEARAYRERVLGELSKRREAARQQIEQLIIGRDRLLQVFDRARTVAVDVVAELTPLTGAIEDLDLSPTTGPIPTVDARTAAPSGPAVSDDAAAADMTGADAADDTAGDAADDTAEDAADETVDEVVLFDDRSDDDAAPTDDATDVATAELVTTAADAADVEIGSGYDEGDDGDELDVDAGGASGVGGDNVVALFARLRAETTSPEPEPEPTDAGEPTRTVDTVHPNVTVDTVDPVDPIATVDTADPIVDDQVGDDTSDVVEDDTSFARRDAALTPLIVAAARKLKRVLADEQNDVLDLLRRREPVTTLDELLPQAAAHAERFAAAITDELAAAAEAGAAEVGSKAPGTAERTRSALDVVRASFGSDLVAPLRGRLERAVSDGGGDNDDVARRVRAVYREWKTQHIDVHLDDLLRAAHGGGLVAAIAPGTPVVWTVDPSGPGCPDCDDNALAGSVPAGEAFPTGHRVAPAHPGCRCLLAPTDR